MITGKRRHGAVAWILTAVMVATCIFAGSPMSAEAAPVQSQPTIDRAAQWEEVQSLIGRYQGEWNDSTYPGLITNRIPQTALLGNGDVGVTSGGDSLSKNFYISKGDFWRFKGSPVPIGGVKIAPVLDVEPPKVSLAQGKRLRPTAVTAAFRPSGRSAESGGRVMKAGFPTMTGPMARRLRPIRGF